MSKLGNVFAQWLATAFFLVAVLYLLGNVLLPVLFGGLPLF